MFPRPRRRPAIMAASAAALPTWRIPMHDEPEFESQQGVQSECADAVADGAARIAELEEKLRLAEKQVALIRQAHAESAAEFDKIKERMRRHQEQELERARLGMAKNLFDVADNFDRTVDAAAQGSDRETLLAGVVAVRDLFLRSLTGFGLERYGLAGEPFDPNLHEAIGMVPVALPGSDGKLATVFQPGYRAGNEVLRPARVQVGKYVEPPNVNQDG
jgi:molecular chaperone GrpE